MLLVEIHSHGVSCDDWSPNKVQTQLMCKSRYLHCSVSMSVGCQTAQNCVQMVSKYGCFGGKGLY